MRSKPVLFSLLAAAIIVLIVTVNDNQNVATQEIDATTQTQQTTIENSTATTPEATSTEPIEADTDESPETTSEPILDDKSQAVVTTPNVESAPVIFTGYGHSESKPLPQGQATSTSCTTDANVECQITFTNIDTEDSFTATITTNNQGVGLYEWVGGETVTTGTWQVTAVAGNKTSETETIYVQ